MSVSSGCHEDPVVPVIRSGIPAKAPARQQEIDKHYYGSRSKEPLPNQQENIHDAAKLPKLSSLNSTDEKAAILITGCGAQCERLFNGASAARGRGR